MVKKKSLIALLLISLITVLVGCEKKPIFIGYSSNLTGTSSEIAVEGMYGAMMAVNEINEEGGINGREVQLVIKDDGNSDETALKTDKELVEQGVCAIIGHSISGVAGLTIPYINSIEMVMVSPTISSTNFAYQDDFFFSMVPVSTYQSKRISEAILDYNYHKTGYLYQIENERYSKSFVEDVQERLEVQGLSSSFISDYSQADEETYDQAIDLILSSDIDSLVIAGAAYDVARFAQILFSKDVHLPIFTSTWAMSSELLSIAGPAAEGIYSINSYDNSSISEDFKAFYDQYMDLYQEEPTFASVYSYEGTMMLLRALMKSDSFKGSDIKKAMESNSSFEGLQGDVTLDEYGDAHRTMYLFKVVNGKYERVD